MFTGPTEKLFNGMVNFEDVNEIVLNSAWNPCEFGGKTIS